jgi:hypothetical protein
VDAAVADAVAGAVTCAFDKNTQVAVAVAAAAAVAVGRLLSGDHRIQPMAVSEYLGLVPLLAEEVAGHL